MPVFWPDIAVMLLAEIFAVAAGFLWGLDFATCRRARRDAAAAERLRAVIHGRDATAPRRCPSGPERCLCVVCRAHGIPPPP